MNTLSQELFSVLYYSILLYLYCALNLTGDYRIREKLFIKKNYTCTVGLVKYQMIISVNIMERAEKKALKYNNDNRIIIEFLNSSVRRRQSEQQGLSLQVPKLTWLVLPNLIVTI